MDLLTLREAARRSARSITTLRRYIRSGRLSAEKRPGRFGPEYFLSIAALDAAGLETEPEVPSAALEVTGGRAPAALGPAPERATHDGVLLSLYRDLQLKHEQLLVQYGMVRAGGLRALELRAEIDDRRHELAAAQAEIERLRAEHDQETRGLEGRLRQAALEQEGRKLEIAALREKVRGLEMLTRNTVTSESIDQQFEELMAQTRRVERADAAAPERSAEDPAGSRPAAREPEH